MDEGRLQKLYFHRIPQTVSVEDLKQVIPKKLSCDIRVRGLMYTSIQPWCLYITDFILEVWMTGNMSAQDKVWEYLHDI
jgi:hypothetical protein